LKIKFTHLCCITVMLLVVACSSADERMIRGKWLLSGSMIGGAPSSFWFKSGGTVIAPWKSSHYATQSEGKYVLLENSRLKIIMNSGYYAGNTYFFDIKKLDDKELILINNFQEIKMKRSTDSDSQK